MRWESFELFDKGNVQAYLSVFNWIIYTDEIKRHIPLGNPKLP